MEDKKCRSCGCIGKMIENILPVNGHPNMEEKVLICECGEVVGVEE